MKLTTNFSLNEFNKRNYNVPTDVLRNLLELAKNLQVLRDEVKKPIKITSGYRPAEHNAKIGGATKSRHITGEAADFKIEGYTPKQVAAIIEKLKSQHILAVFHYISLHNSPFYNQIHQEQPLTESDRYSDCLLRLPLYYELDVRKVISSL